MRYNNPMNNVVDQPPSPDTVRDEYAALPADAQQIAATLITLLHRQSQTRPKRRPTRRVPLNEEPFVGMWRDRPEMEDSVEYIRQLRRREYREPPG